MPVLPGLFGIGGGRTGGSGVAGVGSIRVVVFLVMFVLFRVRRGCAVPVLVSRGLAALRGGAGTALRAGTLWIGTLCKAHGSHESHCKCHAKKFLHRILLMGV